MPASQFLKPDERAIVIFTRGDNLIINQTDHTGSSASWVIDANRRIDRVIIYHREHDSAIAQLYIATFAGTTPEGSRHVVRFEHTQYIGTTDENWHTFADTGAYPIRYLP